MLQQIDHQEIKEQDLKALKQEVKLSKRSLQETCEQSNTLIAKAKERVDIDTRGDRLRGGS